MLTDASFHRRSNARQQRSGSDGAPLDKSRDHRYSLVIVEFVHASIIQDRSGMSREKCSKPELLLWLAVTPPFTSSEFGEIRSLLWAKGLHSVLSSDFAALTAHSGHNLRNEAHADGNRFGFTHRLQDYAASILNGVQAPVGPLQRSACTFWH